MEKLDDCMLKITLKHHPDWKIENGRLTRTWSFPDFVAATQFVNQVAAMAEHAGHHPDIDIRYSRVTLALVTHDADGITEKDTRMVAALDASFTS